MLKSHPVVTSRDTENAAARPQKTFGPRERFFYTGMAFVAAAIVFAGFAPTYFLRTLSGLPPLAPLLHLHGFLFTSWIVLLITQVTLVAARRTDIHRRLGVAGGVLAALMVVVGAFTALNAARHGVDATGAGAPLKFLVIPLFDMLMFSVFVAAAFYYRKRSDVHKRLMLLATLVLLPAAIARLPFAFIFANGALGFFGLADLLLIICVIYDSIAHRRLHPAFLWGGLALIASQPLRLALAGTGAWLAFARWLTG